MTIVTPQNATLIDSISEGYAAINRRPWIILLPILLNVYLWFGPQLSLGPLITGAVGALRQMQPAVVADEETQRIYDQLLAMSGLDLRAELAVLNYVPTLQRYVVGAAGNGAATPVAPQVLQPIDPQRSGTIELRSIGAAVLAFLAINSVALTLSALFLGQAGAAVRRDWSPRMGLQRAPRIGASILAALGVVLAVGLTLALPLLFFTFLLLQLSQLLGGLLLFLLYWAGVWVSIYIGFTREAIVVSGLGPLRAIYASFNVVRRNFWGTLGFLIVTWVVHLGSGVIWQALASSLAGALIAIVGSAYIGTGLVAARMAFYHERLRRWQGAAVQPGLKARN